MSVSAEGSPRLCPYLCQWCRSWTMTYLNCLTKLFYLLWLWTFSAFSAWSAQTCAGLDIAQWRCSLCRRRRRKPCLNLTQSISALLHTSYDVLWSSWCPTCNPQSFFSSCSWSDSHPPPHDPPFGNLLHLKRWSLPFISTQRPSFSYVRLPSHCNRSFLSAFGWKIVTSHKKHGQFCHSLTKSPSLSVVGGRSKSI